ncbi:MAG: LysR family transcriptional regulator [Acidimicrobiales bacterium]
MDTRQLAIFLEVVDEGGFTRAADSLALAQPSVSQAIAALEEDLGTQLFHRLGRSVRLTPAGEALVLAARQVRRDLANARQAVEEVAGLSSGRLDLACLPTLAAAPLGPLVGKFRVSYPGVSIVLSDPQDTAELLDFVRKGRSELGLVERVEVEDLSLVSLGSQDFRVVLPPGSKAASPFRLKNLGSMPLVAAPAGSSTRSMLDDALRAVGVTANVVVEAAQREALLPLIAAGAGAALLPVPLADLAGALGCVVVEPRPAVCREVALVHRFGPLTPAAEKFTELAQVTSR